MIDALPLLGVCVLHTAKGIPVVPVVRVQESGEVSIIIRKEDIEHFEANYYWDAVETATTLEFNFIPVKS